MELLRKGSRLSVQPVSRREWQAVLGMAGHAEGESVVVPKTLKSLKTRAMTAPWPRIEHFAVFAADLEALKDFYAGAFGMRVIVDNSHADPPRLLPGRRRRQALEIIGRPAEVGVEPGMSATSPSPSTTRPPRRLERGAGCLRDRYRRDNAEFKTAFFNDPAGTAARSSGGAGRWGTDRLSGKTADYWRNPL